MRLRCAVVKFFLCLSYIMQLRSNGAVAIRCPTNSPVLARIASTVRFVGASRISLLYGPAVLRGCLDPLDTTVTG